MKSFLGFLFGLFCALMIVFIAGENPLTILSILIKSSFGSKYDFGLTLFYMTSLIFTGLSVSVAFKSGLFNIGAEGQLNFSAIAMVSFAMAYPQLGMPSSLLAILFIGVLAGATWGALPGLLKAYRGSHEVIVTMMLNFISAGISSYLISQYLQNPDSQNPESAVIAESFRTNSFDFLNQFFPESPVNLFFLVSIATAIAIHFFFSRSAVGYEMIAVGENPSAAERANISSKKFVVLSLTLSGILASGAAMNEVIGYSGQYKIGFSPEFGFMGIAVALMSNNSPLGIIANAFIMSVFHKGASDLDIETETITKDFSKVIQALVLFGVGLQYYINKSGFKINFPGRNSKKKPKGNS
ncbi:MAG: ABC transporter permease [Bdellovibrionaceae bacterium]|nr:ABC transporter permease [Pseudobdellovibrionaceae bacterium]